MSDDESRFEEFLQREARDYNAPPAAVPRDAMWEKIAAARRTEALGRTVAPAHGAATPFAGEAMDELAVRRQGPRRVWIAAVIGLAATLAIGVGLGRMSVSGPEAQVARVSAPGAAAGSTGSPATGTESFDVAAAEHLGRAEALLTTYKGEARSRAGDRAINNWTKDMLSTTRLLLDSPAAKDVATRKLLEDLEVVLVQMVQLPTSAGAEDRKMIERTLEHGQLLTQIGRAHV